MPTCLRTCSIYSLKNAHESEFELIEILLIRLSLRVNRISIKGLRRRDICKADKGGAGAVGLVSIGPGAGIRCFGAHNSSFGICRRPTGRTPGDRTRDTSGPGERRHPIHRRERRGPRRAASKAGRQKIGEMNRSILGPSKPTVLTNGPLVATLIHAFRWPQNAQRIS
jgi:hypothetical protein